MVTQCVSPIKADTMRVTLLDQCGVPVTGDESAQVTSKSFTEISNSPNYEEGQRFLLRQANGEPCVNERDPGFLNWLEQTTNVCTLDPDMAALVTGDDVVMDGVDNVGVIFCGGLLTARFSTEVWQPVSGAGACDESGLQRYVYWAFPHQFDAQIQEFTFANDTFTFSYTSITKAANSLWNIGDPWLADNPAATWGPDCHYAFAITTTPPPEAACGATEVAS